MPKLTLFPLGNADTCLIDLVSGEKLLFDYAAFRDASNEDDRRVDLPKFLLENLQDADRDEFDVVAITHLDRDHYCGASEFFYLEHATKYQSKERVKIKSLWVPAAVIVEEGVDDEARIIQAEARHRLLAGEGIRVFSRPAVLAAWLSEHGLSIEERAGVITDAGTLVPDFSTSNHGVEFFVHSPFANRLTDGSIVDRNTCSVVVQATFLNGGIETKVLLGADADHEVLAAMVDVTRYKKNDARLEWDVLKLWHHCSYLSLGPEKGVEKTEPVENVEWLLNEQGHEGAVIVSPSDPIPSTDEVQPPHRQAANYYREVAENLGGEFKVTMEHPDTSEPAPLVIVIDEAGAAIEKRVPTAAAFITTNRAPRAG